MYYTLDRIENSTAILIDEKDAVLTVPVVSLQGEWREGTVFTHADGVYFADEEETARRRCTSVSRFRKIFR